MELFPVGWETLISLPLPPCDFLSFLFLLPPLARGLMVIANPEALKLFRIDAVNIYSKEGGEEKNTQAFY